MLFCRLLVLASGLGFQYNSFETKFAKSSGFGRDLSPCGVATVPVLLLLPQAGANTVGIKRQLALVMKILIEGWDPVDKQPVRGTLEGVDRAQTQAADLVTVQLQHGRPVVLKQNPTALKGSHIRVGACAWDGAYVLSAYLDAQPPGAFAGGLHRQRLLLQGIKWTQKV